MTRPHSPFNSDFTESGDQHQLVMRLVAALMMLFVISSYLMFADLRSHGFSLVFYLAICDFAINVQSVFFAAFYPIPGGSLLCYAEAAGSTFWVSTGMLWTGLISLSLFSFVGDGVDVKYPNLRRFVSTPKLYHPAIWGYCLVTSAAPIFIKGGYGTTRGEDYCFFIFSRSISYELSLVFFWGPVWGTILLSFALNFYLRRRIGLFLSVRSIDRSIDSSTRTNIRASFVKSDTLSNERHRIVQLHDQLKWYPAILLVAWSMDSSFRIYQMLTGATYESMPLWTRNMFWYTSGYSWQPILNALVYGFTPAVRQRWRQYISTSFGTCIDHSSTSGDRSTRPSQEMTLTRHEGNRKNPILNTGTNV
jgi:hypothetical protein